MQIKLRHILPIYFSFRAYNYILVIVTTYFSSSKNDNINLLQRAAAVTQISNFPPRRFEKLQLTGTQRQRFSEFSVRYK